MALLSTEVSGSKVPNMKVIAKTKESVKETTISVKDLMGLTSKINSLVSKTKKNDIVLVAGSMGLGDLIPLCFSVPNLKIISFTQEKTSVDAFFQQQGETNPGNLKMYDVKPGSKRNFRHMSKADKIDSILSVQERGRILCVLYANEEHFLGMSDTLKRSGYPCFIQPSIELSVKLKKEFEYVGSMDHLVRQPKLL
jgi:hypothetical protein